MFERLLMSFWIWWRQTSLVSARVHCDKPGQRFDSGSLVVVSVQDVEDRRRQVVGCRR